MRKSYLIIVTSFLMILSCSLQEVTDKDLELGEANVKILDNLNLIDAEEDEAVKKVIGVDETEQTPVSKENKILKGRVTTLESEIDKINNDMNNLRLELVMRDGKIMDLKDSLSTLKRSYKREFLPEKKPIVTKTGLSYGERYRMALNEFNGRKYSYAMSIFKELLDEDSKNVLADNCQYWIGECYYGLKEYRKALFEFEKVLTYGQSNKDDDTQLKIGLCYVQLNELDKAQEELNRLLLNYPKSEYNNRAKRILSRIGGR